MTLNELTPEEIAAGLPPEIATTLAQADPDRGQKLTVDSGCTACHSLEKDVRLVGPSWYNVGDHAVTRVEGESPALYLYNSIVDPNAFVIEGYPANVMPSTFRDALSDQDIADIIAYLLTFHGGK